MSEAASSLRTPVNPLPCGLGRSRGLGKPRSGNDGPAVGPLRQALSALLTPAVDHGLVEEVAVLVALEEPVAAIVALRGHTHGECGERVFPLGDVFGRRRAADEEAAGKRRQEGAEGKGDRLQDAGHRSLRCGSWLATGRRRRGRR